MKVKYWGEECEAFFDVEKSKECNTPVWLCHLSCGNTYLHERELEFLEEAKQDKDIDWEARRFEISKEALTAIMSNKDFCILIQTLASSRGNNDPTIAICQASVVFADKLIEELKKTK